MSTSIVFDILARDRASDKFDKLGRSADNSSSKLKSLAKGGLLAAAGGALLAGGAMVKWGADSVQALKRIETINAQSRAAIKSTGGAAGVSAKHVEALAGKIENLTASEAEAVQEGANLLLTFTNVQNKAGKGNKVFDDATKIMNDMSVAMGTDVKSSAMLVGKALNDPVKGATALSRAGVQLTDQQKEQIKTFTESGDTMKAQKIILGELEKQFGGSGEAFAKTAEGKFALVGHKFGEIGETIMTGLMPALGKGADFALKFMKSLQDNGTIDKVSGAFSRVGEVLQSNLGPAFRAVGEWVRENLMPVLRDLGEKYLTYIAKVMPAVKNAFKDAQPFFELVGNVITKVLVPGLGKLLEAAGPVLVKAIEKIGEGLGAVGEIGTWLWNKALQPTFKFIVGGVGKILEMFASLLDTMSNVPGFGWAEKAAEKMANAAQKAADMAAGIKKIPSRKDVAVVVSYTYRGLRGPGGSGSTRGRDDDFMPSGRAALASQKSAAQRFMEAVADGLEKGGKKVDKILKASRDRLKDSLGQIRDDMKSMGESIASAINQTDFGGGVAELMASLSGNGTALTGLSSVFANLASNVSKGFLEALMSSGNVGLATALGNDPASAAAASAAFDRNAALASNLGEKSAQAVLGDKLDAAVKRETDRLLDELRKAPEKQAKALREVLKDLIASLIPGKSKSAGQGAHLKGAW